MRYLIDNNVSPCSWHEVEVIEEKNIEGVRVGKIYSAKTLPVHLDNVDVPFLRVLGFSMICYSREGSPKPDRNPTLIISTATSDGQTKQFIANDDKKDKTVIEEFIAYICQFDPDIIASCGANSADWTYLRGRSHKLKLKLDFDRAKMEPHTSVYGHVSTTGIEH
jgi:DNA polymerase I